MIQHLMVRFSWTVWIRRSRPWTGSDVSQICDFSFSLVCNPNRLRSFYSSETACQFVPTSPVFLVVLSFSGGFQDFIFNRDPALSVFRPPLPPLVRVLFNNNSWTISVHFRCRGHGGEFWGCKWTPSSFTASAAECINIFKLAKERVLQICD